jgi:AcrR family transcriptional regulator
MTVKQNKPRRTYGGVAPEERDAQRREALVAAGIAAFGERGYAVATIESLCAQASVSTRDFYHYFASKEQLLLAVYDQIIDRTIRNVGAAVGSALVEGAESTTVIRAGISAFATSMVDDERWARINFIEIVGVSGDVEARRREVIADFGRFVAGISETLVERGDFDRGALTPVHSVAMVGAIHETLTDWLLQSERAPLDQTIDALVEIFAAVLRR